MDEENLLKLKNYALKLLSLRPRSYQELTLRLQNYSKKYSISILLIDKLIKDLEKNNLINDEEFIHWWIDQRNTFRPKGKIVLKIELLKKGIDSKLIDKCLENLKGKVSEFDLSIELLNKKKYIFKNLVGNQKKKKMIDLLARRGFDWEVIYKVIDSYK